MWQVLSIHFVNLALTFSGKEDFRIILLKAVFEIAEAKVFSHVAVPPPGTEKLLASFLINYGSLVTKLEHRRRSML